MNPILKHQQVLMGLVNDLALKEYIIRAPEGGKTLHRVFGRSEAQAVRIAVNSLNLPGEIEVWDAGKWEACISQGGKYTVEPNRYEGRFSGK